MDVVQIGCIKQVFNRLGKVNIMENTKDNKEKFFAQYWGQKVGKTDYESQLWINERFLNSISFLQLKPLSSITDEDAIEVSKIWGSKVESKILGNIIAIRIGTKAESEVRNSIGVIDFLRSKSYALPYMGLSVETMIEYGWIKLTQ